MAGSGSTRVLVTGAGGFIGSHLAADQAQRGRSVRALDRDLSRIGHLATRDRFDLLEGDVADRELLERAVRGTEIVFHLAAAHLTVSAREDEFRRVNVDAVQSLVEACIRHGVRRLVHCSTVGVHGRIDDPPADEDSPCRPDIPYERTKLEGERVVLAAVRERSLPAVVLRPTWVYGPGCPRTEKLFAAVARGRFLVAGSGRNLRHCVYIRDMLEAFELAATVEAAEGRVLIIGDAEAVTVRRLVDEVARLTQARPPRSVPAPLLLAAGATAEIAFGILGREPPISRRTLKFFTSNTAFDIARARDVLGYRPRYDLACGLAETHRIMSAGLAPAVPLPEAVAG